MRRVLLVDDDAAVREALGQTLELADCDALTAGSFVECKDHITPAFEGIIVSDIRMQGRDGFYLLNYARNQDVDLPVILLTGEGDIPMAVKAMGEGAFDFLEKPCAPSDLMDVIERALKTRALVLENRALKAQLEAGDPASRLIFGKSVKAEILRQEVRAAARTGTEVLITGAPGSGISKVAEVIHLSSPRAKGPFEKRASSGLSRSDVATLTQACAGGSLFLDEISALAMDTQMAVLDALERDALWLMAGNTRELSQDVAEGRLNADLYYRLDVLQVHIPALSERPEDIPVLFRQYVEQASEQSGTPAPEISHELFADLMARDWPGNARSLMSHAMRFVLGLDEGRMDGALDIPAGIGLAEQMARVEQSLLQDALYKAEGQASAAASALKLPRKTFYDKLAKYGIRPEAFRR